jgi:hypothetical protein
MSISSKEIYAYEPSEYSSEMLSDDGEFEYDDLDMKFRKNHKNHKYHKMKTDKDISKDDINFIYHKVNGIRKKTFFYTTSSLPGATIRNACTGNYQIGYHVGKADEHNFFKMAMTVGLGKNIKGRNHLYYDNPEQYESHFNTVLSDGEIKLKWYEKQKKLNK